MIDKLSLNNEIVAMRKFVRQAKVHVITKLVREVKKLRERHGPDNVKAKYNRKADRKGEEILFIKKLNTDDVTKFALKNSENLIEKLANPNTTIEGRALFRLASHKIIAEKVEQFRTKNPDWEDLIVPTLDELGARRKKTVKRSEKLEVKSNSSVQKCSKSGEPDRKKPLLKTSHGTNALQTNELRESSDDEKDEVKQPISKWSVKEVKTMFLSEWIVEEIEPVKLEKKKRVNEFKRTENIKELKGKKPTINDKFSSIKSGDLSSSKKSGGVSEIRKFNDFLGGRNFVPDGGNSKEVLHVDDEVPSNDKEAVDPFFVRSDGKTEYRTSVVVEENDDKEDGEPWDRERKPFGREWEPRRGESHRGRGQPGRGRGQPDGGKGHFGGHNNRERGGVRGKSPRFGGRGEHRGRDITFKRNSDGPPAAGEVNLHPSWEAKRKQKEQSISSVVFQGKKIKFDDDD